MLRVHLDCIFLQLSMTKIYFPSGNYEFLGIIPGLLVMISNVIFSILLRVSVQQAQRQHLGIKMPLQAKETPKILKEMVTSDEFILFVAKTLDMLFLFRQNKSNLLLFSLLLYHFFFQVIIRPFAKEHKNKYSTLSVPNCMKKKHIH